MEPTRELTFGEKAVGLTFNPGGMPEVNAIKTACAVVIDELNNQRQATFRKAEEDKKVIWPETHSSVPKSDEISAQLRAIDTSAGEKAAQFTLAIRKIQEGQMWGVKAATWQY